MPPKRWYFVVVVNKASPLDAYAGTDRDEVIERTAADPGDRLDIYRAFASDVGLARLMQPREMTYVETVYVKDA